MSEDWVQALNRQPSRDEEVEDGERKWMYMCGAMRMKSWMRTMKLDSVEEEWCKNISHCSG